MSNMLLVLVILPKCRYSCVVEPLLQAQRPIMALLFPINERFACFVRIVFTEWVTAQRLLREGTEP